MQLVHYSRAPVGPLRSVPEQEPATLYTKPRGLWVSVEGNGDGWRDWCLGERFALESLTHVHDVTLRPDANVLHLSGAADLDGFTRGYGRDAGYGVGIDWRAVASRFRGIIIAPYVWSRRLHEDTNWYYSWDVASGCIWDVDAIAAVTLREVVPVPEASEAA